MKKIHESHRAFWSKAISSCTLAILINLNALAGDAFTLNYNIRSTFFIDDEQSIEATFANEEAYDVTDFDISIQIKYKISASDWDIVFDYNQEGLTLEANSTLDISTSPTIWSPMYPGIYQLVIDSYSPVDINPSNNRTQHDFLVGNFYRLPIKQFNIKNPFQVERSTLGAIGFKLPPVDQVKFYNVIAQKPMTTTTTWLVKNLPILPFSSDRTLYYHFDYSSLGYSNGDVIESLDIAVQEDDTELSEEFDYYGFVNKKVWYIDYDIAGDNEETDVDNPSILDELGDLPVPLFGDVYSIDYEYIGCEMPNIELDSSTHGISEDYAGDWNACGPAAAANSLQWLENTVTQIPDTETTHREKMEELSALMERGDGQGVTTDQLVKGKLAYIDKYQLPIHVKYQSWFNQDDSIASPDTTYGHYAENRSDSASHIQNPPTWKFLKNELKNGEDVEVLFGWYRKADGRRMGGHWVTVSGVSETNYAKGVYIKEDFSQGDSGRLVHERFLNWEKGERFGRLVGYDLPEYTCWVESVVSESYDPSITFGNAPAPNSNIQATNEVIAPFIILNNSSAVDDPVLVQFTLNEPVAVQIRIYSSLGNLISEHHFNPLDTGIHSRNILEHAIDKPGNYYIQLNYNNSSHVAKLIKL